MSRPSHLAPRLCALLAVAILQPTAAHAASDPSAKLGLQVGTLVNVQCPAPDLPHIVAVRSLGDVADWFNPRAFEAAIADELPDGSEVGRAPTVYFDNTNERKIRDRLAGDYGSLFLVELVPAEQRVDAFLSGHCLSGSIEEVEMQSVFASPHRTVSTLPSSPIPAGRTGRAGIEWVRIPGGTFQMGSNRGDSDETPVHLVRVSSFELMKTEVTVGQYRKCVEAGSCTAPSDKTLSKYCNWGWSGREDHPVNCVDWNQAQAFARWAGGRLPTEAEWEYAARSGGKTWTYPWGDERATCSRAILSDGGRGCDQKRTGAVCSKPAGNSTHGVCDLAGNVWEWVQDGYHNSYRGAPGEGKAWEGGASSRVIRGGSWDDDASYLRASNRNRDGPSDRFSRLGFRLAR